MNYPPGFDPKTLDGDNDAFAEQIRDNVEVRYELKVFVDNDQVFTGDYHSEESLQESGLRKADHAIDEAIELIVDAKLEEQPDEQ